MDKAMMDALRADAEKLAQLTGDDHTPEFLAGTREVDTFQSDKCPTCLGDGYIGQHANLPDVKCPNCSGTGFVDTAPNVELLIENLVQAAAEYENNCDRLVAKTIRVQLEKAKQAIRDAITTQRQRSAETAQVRFGFASFKGGKFELIVINIKTGEEVLLEGQLRPDQTIEQIDKVLPTCVYVTGEPQTAPLPVEAIRAAVTLLARKITKLRWSRDECRRKGQDVYVANLTAQIDQLDGYYHALSSLALSRPQSQTGKVCGYHDGCPPDGPVCHLCAHLQPGASK